MTRWARLTWQAEDAPAFAAGLAERLGTSVRPGGLVPHAGLVRLDGSRLEVRPWIRERADDDPRAGGRLMLEPVPGGEEDVDGDGQVPVGLALAGIGWATVELDRAQAELEPWIGPPVAVAADDPHLGARARAFVAGGLPGERIVLLEPTTEGRVAASLARDGEGPCAIYLRPEAGLGAWIAGARSRGVRLVTRRIGPLGAAVLVAGGPVAGPHLLLVQPRPDPNRAAGASTIGA